MLWIVSGGLGDDANGFYVEIVEISFIRDIDSVLVKT
jgi:hypothetical protein